jgi:hypothetical protein
MNKFFLIFLIIPLTLVSQNRDYKKRIKSNSFRFFALNEDIYVKDLITKSAKLGYEIMLNSDNEIIRKGVLGNYIILSKSIDNDDFFPSYAVGRILKKIIFLQDKIETAIISNSITQAILVEYSNVNKSKIDNFYNSTINFVKDHINYNNNIDSTVQLFESPFYHLYYENKYSYADVINYSFMKNDFRFNRKFSYGKRSDNVKSTTGYDRWNYLCLQFNDDIWDSMDNLNNLSISSQKNKSKILNSLRSKIGNKDMMDINIYDLKEMVKFFLEDCKRSNIKVPKIETLSTRFEPLDDGVIALSYAMGDDSKIVIKVDPKKWQNSSKQKKWYIMYHELGHDVLNLNHGEGGKMMFNFADREYSWDEFYKDKDYMFNYVNGN